jgi:SAM-dependent methyltransferase
MRPRHAWSMSRETLTKSERIEQEPKEPDRTRKNAETHPRHALAQLLVGNQLQQAIYVAARLGIADHLAQQERSSEELAARVGAHPRALQRLMRVLVSFRVFAQSQSGAFAIAPIGALLQSDVPGSMKSFALWSGGVSYRTFGGLEHSVKHGKPAFEEIFGAPFFEYLASSPDDSGLFDEMLAWNTTPLLDALCSLDLSSTRLVVDIGGGRGDLLKGLLASQPHLRGILVDGPRVQVRARELIAAAGLESRCEIRCADILSADLPAGELYVLKSVIHGLDDRDAAQLLANCRRAMAPGGRVWLIELILPPGDQPSPSKLMDLLMLVGCDGRERTENEYRTLISANELQVSRIVPLKNGFSLLELTAAGSTVVHPA